MTGCSPFDAYAVDQEVEGAAIVLDFVPTRPVSQCVQTLALALMLVTGLLVDARADQAPALMPLPMSVPIAQTDSQCCRVCKKGIACGDGLHQLGQTMQAPGRMRLLNAKPETWGP